jgi:hypothetical protein
LPISPIKLFVAVNDEAVLVDLRKAKPRDIARRLNKFIASRARRFVWSRDKSQERFIENNMSTRLEPTCFRSADRNVILELQLTE